MSHVGQQHSPRGFAWALGLTFGLMLLIAGGVADRGGFFPLVVLGVTGMAMGALYLIIPYGPQFALGTANGLAMYACLFVVLGRAGFPEATAWSRPAGFMLPVLSFVLACWWRRRALRAWVQGERAVDLAHLPRFARWLVATGAVGVLSLSLPVNRLDEMGQGAALLVAMAAIALIAALSVSDVVRLLVDVAAIFRAVTRRLGYLAVPIAAYSSLWALLAVVFGCLYRIADGISRGPLFAGPGGPLRLDFPAALHFSVVTLSTVGYGEIVPTDDGVRVLASIEMLFSQLLLLFGFFEIMRGSRAGAPAEPLPPQAQPPGAFPGAPHGRHGQARE